MQKFVFALALCIGCSTREVPLEGAPCPCLVDQGYFCCESTQTCLQLGETCGPGAALELLDIRPKEGPLEGGLMLTLMGKNFVEGLEATVGGARCEGLQLISSSELSCVLPPGAERRSQVDVRLFSADGPHAALPGGFRYLLRPFVNVTSEANLGTSAEGIGITIADFDADGRWDIYFPSASFHPPHLFKNLGALRFEEARSPWGLEVFRHVGAIADDFNGDGFIDLLALGDYAGAVTTGRSAALLTSQGGGFFDLRFDHGLFDFATSKGTPFIGGSVDVDGNGTPDFVGARVVGTSSQFDNPNPFPITLAYNNGDVFRESPENFNVRSTSSTLAVSSVALGDFDRDGDADMISCFRYMALLRQNNERLLDFTFPAGLPTLPANYLCSSVRWVDFDADGDLDIALLAFGENIFREFTTTRSGTLFYRNESTGASDTRFVQEGPLEADDTSFECPLAAHNLPGASLLAGALDGAFADFDHDGDIDILLPRPFFTCVEQPVLYRSRYAQGEASFEAQVLEHLPTFGDMTTTETADLDDDGDMDVVLRSWGGSDWAIFKNNLIEATGSSAGPAGHYLIVEARTGAPARLAQGVTIELDMDGPNEAPDFAVGPGKLQTRAIGVAGYGANAAPVAHFGLGRPSGSVWARVQFPDGSITQMKVVEFDRKITLVDCDMPRCP